MQTLLQDTRYALRQLSRSPGFFATAVLTLALGIGATTAIFTLIYQVILRSMPVTHPEELYRVGKEIKCCEYGGVQKDWSIFSYDLYKYLRDQTPNTAGIAAVDAASLTVSEHRAGDTGNAQPLQLRFVSGNYFSLLGVMPYSGRLLTPNDDQPGAPPAVVLSYTLWQTKFGADPGITGSTIILSGHPVTVVGISARNFIGERDTQDPAGLWIPLAFEPTFEYARKLLNFPTDHWLDLLVRIPDSRHVNQVQLAVQQELHQWIVAHRAEIPTVSEQDVQKANTQLFSASDGINTLREQYEHSLKLLFAVAGFVLLIACANLANLMMVRSMARQQELAVRSALGAPRARLIRQMLVEAILLSLCGGAAALIVAYAGTRGILAMTMGDAQMVPISASPSLPVLGFALIVSLLTGIVFGIVPAWIISRSNPVEALRGANRSTRDATALPQKVLVILQAALSLTLLSTAGLLISSLRTLEHQDFHFEPQGRLLLFIDLPAAGYHASQLSGLYQRFDETFARVPGVRGFAYATYTPMAQNNFGGDVFLPGSTTPADTDGDTSYLSVSPGYFESVGSRILMGRGITQNDTAASAHVAVVNQAFVQKFFKGKPAIGEHFGNDPKTNSEFEIVGVAENTKYNNPDQPVNPMYMTPITQTSTFDTDEKNSSEAFKHFANNIVFQYQGDPGTVTAAVRQALRSIDPNIPIMRTRTYADQLSVNFTQEELVVRLTTLFGILALILASIGLYGVTAYAVARRTREIGVRMALGASRGSVLNMVVRNALTQGGIGLLIGLPLAAAAGRLVQHTLYQTNSFDPIVIVSVIVLLLIAASIAALVPARRAASIDPMQALRTE